MDVTLGVAWFKNSLAGNEIWRFLAWLGVVCMSFLVGRLTRYYLQRAAGLMDRRGKHVAAIVLRSFGRSIVFVLTVVAIKSGLHFLDMSEAMLLATGTATTVLMVVATTYVIYCLIDGLCHVWALAAAKSPSKLDDMLVPMVRRTARITLVLLALVQVATVLSDKPLTSILAGLGVGGLAVALAAQETIKNFFGLVIVLTDKPFELGDRIIVDKYDGVVEGVGVRSTRIRTADGNLITIPNSDLGSKAIENVGKKLFFFRSMDVQITYDTPPEKIERALAILKEILAGHPGMRPDKPPRVVLSDLASSSISIKVLYWVHVADYWEFMAFSEFVNLSILKRFAAERIALAVPPQTVYLTGNKGTV